MLIELDGDEELLRKLSEIFTENTPGILASISESITARDSGGLERASHKLVGSVGAFGAEPARKLALCLEEMGRLSDFAKAAEKFANLEQEINKIYEALAEFSACVPDHASSGDGRRTTLPSLRGDDALPKFLQLLRSTALAAN